MDDVNKMQTAWILDMEQVRGRFSGNCTTQNTVKARQLKLHFDSMSLFSQKAVLQLW